MLYIEERTLQRLLRTEYQKGIERGKKLAEEKLLFAYENGNPINIEGKAYFIKSDIENLRDIFEDLESENRQ
jgi:transcriptional regulator of heat shock response